MKPAEKDIVIEKIRQMPEEQVEKVMIFVAGLEAGGQIKKSLFVQEGKAKEGLLEEE